MEWSAGGWRRWDGRWGEWAVEAAEEPAHLEEKIGELTMENGLLARGLGRVR